MSNSSVGKEVFDVNPFPEEPPAYMRIKLFHYDFSRLVARDKKELNQMPKVEDHWWVRKFSKLYLPEIEVISRSILGLL